MRRLAPIARVVHRSLSLPSRARRLLSGLALIERFGSHGKNFVFDPDGTYTYESIHVGDNVDLGLRPTIMAPLGGVRIGSNVILGPEVAIRGGNHRTDVVGSTIAAAKKVPGDRRFDLGVIIEDDVWIGTRAIILQGVTVGRGAVIGAGAVVTSSIPRYAIAAGVPARVIRMRWDAATIAEHERRLYGAAGSGAGESVG
jgi:chloramphenicol O-acetyltransferase type B